MNDRDCTPEEDAAADLRARVLAARIKAFEARWHEAQLREAMERGEGTA